MVQSLIGWGILILTGVWLTITIMVSKRRNPVDISGCSKCSRFSCGAGCSVYDAIRNPQKDLQKKKP